MASRKDASTVVDAPEDLTLTEEDVKDEDNVETDETDVSWLDVKGEDADDNGHVVTRGQLRAFVAQYASLFEYHRNR